MTKTVTKVLIGIVSAVLIVACTVIFAVINVMSHNKYFPEKYISMTYPDAEILDSGYTGGFMFDQGNLYYECRDKNTGMKFEQQFEKSGLFGKLEPFEHSAYGYKASLKEWNAENAVIEKAESILEAEHFMVHNPLNSSGVVIVAKNESAENVDSLIKALNGSISEMNMESGVYVCYTIISCDDCIYKEIEQVDFENLYSGTSGQCTFFDIAKKMDIQFERITAKNIGNLDYDTYNAKGDPNDDNYISADNFDGTAITIIGEVNAKGNQNMWVFGINL